MPYLPTHQKKLKNQEQMRNKVTDIHQSGKGYKSHSESFQRFQQIMLRAIIHKLTKHAMEQWWLFQGVGSLQKLPKEHSEDSSGRSQRNPGQRLKNCWPFLNEGQCSWPNNEEEAKNIIHRRDLSLKPLRTKKNRKAHLAFGKCIWMIPQTFGRIFFGLTKRNFLEGMCLVTSDINATPHYGKRTSY